MTANHQTYQRPTKRRKPWGKISFPESEYEVKDSLEYTTLKRVVYF